MEKKFVWRRLLALLLAVSMVLSSQSFTALANTDTIIGFRKIANIIHPFSEPVDFTDWLNDSEGAWLEYYDSVTEHWVKINPGDNPEGLTTETPVRMHVAYEVPPDYQDIVPGDKIKLKIPNNMVANENVKGDVTVAGGNIVGDYSISGDEIIIE